MFATETYALPILRPLAAAARERGIEVAWVVPPAVARQDFLMQGPGEHGVAGLINLFGIESPGLTSSLAIADHVAGMAGVRD